MRKNLRNEIGAIFQLGIDSHKHKKSIPESIETEK
jgi:hypothetical protein